MEAHFNGLVALLSKQELLFNNSPILVDALIGWVLPDLTSTDANIWYFNTELAIARSHATNGELLQRLTGVLLGSAL